MVLGPYFLLIIIIIALFCGRLKEKGKINRWIDM
jgi:hypothetical protein